MRIWQFENAPSLSDQILEEIQWFDAVVGDVPKRIVLSREARDELFREKVGIGYAIDSRRDKDKWINQFYGIQTRVDIELEGKKFLLEE